jgi:hypothetical protein
MRVRGVVRVLGAALALAVVVGGCGNDGSGSSPRVNVAGNANFPIENGGQAVTDSPFVIVDPRRLDDPLADDVTTSDGRFFGIVRKTVSVAVIVTGRIGNDTIRVSGLLAAESNNVDKQLDGQTDIACEAGVTAVQDGSIDGDDLGADRIANLEAAAQRFVATTDFTDPASVTAAAIQVRVLTDDGAHPAP